MKERNITTKKLFSALLLSVLVFLSVCVSSSVATTEEPIDWEYQIAYQRGIEAVNWAIPAVSMLRFREAYFSLGGGFNTIYYLSQPPTPKTETLTANNQTGYATILMSTKDGPVVLDIPPASDRAMIFGSAVDIWEVPVADMGPAGLDQGRGGKYLFLPPGYQGEIPGQGYIVIRATQNSHNFMIRGLVQGDDVAGAVTAMKMTKVYPWKERKNPKPNQWFSISGDTVVDTIPPQGLQYWQRLANFIHDNPVGML